MRTLGLVVLGAVVSFMVAMAVLGGAILLGLVAQPGPHQGFELVAVTAAMAIVALGTALILLIVLAAGGRRKAVRRTAVVLAILLVAVLAAPLVFGLATAHGDPTAEDGLGPLAQFLGGLAVPGVLAIIVQWWIVRRAAGTP